MMCTYLKKIVQNEPKCNQGSLSGEEGSNSQSLQKQGREQAGGTSDPCVFH